MTVSGGGTRVGLTNAIFEHLEISYTRRQRHSALSMLTHDELGARHRHVVA